MFHKPVGSPLVRLDLGGTKIAAASNERTSDARWPDWPNSPWLAELERRFGAQPVGSPAAAGDRG